MKLHSVGIAEDMRNQTIGRIVPSGGEVVPAELRRDLILLWNHDHAPEDSDGFAAVAVPNRRPKWQVQGPLIHSFSGLDYLAEKDVISVSPTGFIRTLYRRSSSNNSILLTEQCNSYCLMCSQPPREAENFDQMVQHFRLVELIDKDTTELGVTGGEPTLFKRDFIRMIRHCLDKLPNTALHILTNGRMFFYRNFAMELAEIKHPNLMLGIPLYSDVDFVHDYVVQSRGAFEETILGLHHLAQYDVQIEVRVVIHRQTYARLPQLAEFIARNCPFVAKVALMGLEMFGFVHRNLDTLWIDPWDYRAQLSEAVQVLATRGIPVSIYNHQLCTIDEKIWPFSCKSISDWKNIYLPECEDCSKRNDCGGFFQSNTKRHSAHIKAI
jgi:His-Xaa-Ser system radical SAM maturase HxsC